MQLQPGTRLGPYEIVGAIGAGGMGEVYRGRDTHLNRDVAIKVLPELFAVDAERVARFTREAQTLAALNHPNIAQIYGLERDSAGRPRALAMELVDGEDLSTIIDRGAVPQDDALSLARQIAAALEVAHDAGIIHRDLKPANVKVRADGAVKVLDFGLAKLVAPEGASATNALQSPTLTARATAMGTIIGTAAYMAPEQARGKTVDRRADIWAFGVVLYELLTGRRAFDGDETSDVLASVLRQEIDWSALPADTPPRLRRLLERCLDRDPKRRLRDIGEVRVILDEKGEDTEETKATKAFASPAASPRLGSRRLLATAIVVAALAAIAAAIWGLTKSQPEVQAAHLSIAMPPGEQVTTVPAISPDGRTIAFASGRTRETSQLYLRAIDSFAVRAVESSRGAQLPFFSPDGRSVAFFAGGKLWRAAVAGGTPTLIVAAPRPWGGSWCRDGTVVFVPNLNAGLWRVSDNGGTAVQLTKPDGAGAGYAHAYPQCLPGTDEVLFSFWGQSFNTSVFSPKTGTWRDVTPRRPFPGSASIGVFAGTGYVLVGDGTSGMTAARWTPADTSPKPPDTAVLDGVYWVSGSERPWFNIAANGTAVYAPGTQMKRRLVWVDRKGSVTPLPGGTDLIKDAALSRDGHRVVHSGKLAQWVADLTSGTRIRVVPDLLTFSGGWLPGDDRVVISTNKDGDWDLFTASTNGIGALKPLLKKPYTQHAVAVAPDGAVVYQENHPQTAADIWLLTPDGHTRPLVLTPFNESNANVSSDGKYLAYVSDESGRNEVYAIPMQGGPRMTISVDGGTGPAWSRDGRELFYRAGDDLMSVEIRSMSPLVLGSRRKLMEVSAFEPAYFHDFDVSADGQRFLFIRAEPDTRPTRINVMLNWFPELERRVGR